MAVRTYGQKRAPALVLLHGFCFDGGMWSDWCADLERDFQVWVPDLPGYGRDDVVRSGGFARDVEALITPLPQRAYYVGWSLGGLFALCLLESYPERVLGVVTIGTNPCFRMRRDWRAGVPDEDMDKFHSIVTAGGEKLAKRRLLALLVRGEENPLHLQKTIAPLMHYPADHVVTDNLAMLHGLDMRDAVSRAGVPMMHMVGDGDALVPPRMASALRALSPGQQVVEMNSTGHALPFSRCVDAIAQLRRFLSQHH